MAIAKGISKVELGGHAAWDILLTFSMTNKIPWHLISKYLNLPWLIGGFVANYFIKRVNEYIAKEDMIGNLKEIAESLETNRISILNSRKELLVAIKTNISETDEDKKKT